MGSPQLNQISHWNTYLAKMTSQVVSRVWYLVSLALFGLLLFLPSLPKLESHGIQVIDESICLLTCVAIYICFHKSSWLWKVLAFFLTLYIFYLPLMRIWQEATSTFNIVLGILPWSDASNYYFDAMRLLHGDLFGVFSGYRPLFSSFLAVLFAVTQENIQIVLVIFTIINACAAFLLTTEIANAYGSLAGVMTIYLLQMYYRQFAGTTLSEQLGFSAGLVALTLILFASRTKKNVYFVVGLFFLSFALFVRPGAFFILPVLILLALFWFSRNKTAVIKNAVLMAVIVSVIWALNAKLSEIVSGSNSMPLGIFSYTLYGQAMGGAGWNQFFIDHPNLTTHSNTELAQIAYRLAFDEILHNPSRFMLGILKSYRDFIVPGVFSIFSFIEFGNDIVNRILQIVLSLLMFIGLIKCWLKRGSLVYSLLLVFALGICLSVPFVPPADASGMRLYAATMAIPCILASVGLPALTKNQFPSSSYAQGSSSIKAALIIGSMLVITPFSAVFIKNNAMRPVLQPMTCPAGSVPVQFYMPAHSFLSVVKNETGQSTHLPVVADKDVRKSLKEFPGAYADFINSLRRAIKPPMILTRTLNFSNGEDVWLVAPPEIIDSTSKIIQACGQFTDSSHQITKITTYK
jgi:hypothetical protein